MRACVHALKLIDMRARACSLSLSPPLTLSLSLPPLSLFPPLLPPSLPPSLFSSLPLFLPPSLPSSPSLPLTQAQVHFCVEVRRVRNLLSAQMQQRADINKEMGMVKEQLTAAREKALYF